MTASRGKYSTALVKFRSYSCHYGVIERTIESRNAHDTTETNTDPNLTIIISTSMMQTGA